jgi:ribosomal protein S18 acetylase RimI-like enzyme
MIREALAGEMAAVGALRVATYESERLLDANPPYAVTLAALGADGHGTVLVAEDGGHLLGTAMLDPWHDGSEIARGPQEAEVRGVAVARQAQGRGVGRALMLAVIDLARVAGASRLLLLTRPVMTAAQALYGSLGFERLPDLDCEPVPEVTLLAFGLPLDQR